MSRKVVPLPKSHKVVPYASPSTQSYDALQKGVLHDWRRAHASDWTENDVTRTSHHQQAGGGRTNGCPDCRETGLFGVDGAQVAAHLRPSRARWLQKPDGATSYWPAGHDPPRLADHHSSAAGSPSWLGARHALNRPARRCDLEAAALTEPLTDSGVPQAHGADPSLPEAFRAPATAASGASRSGKWTRKALCACRGSVPSR